MSDTGQTTKFLIAPGALGAMILAHDWAATPLGPIAAWPQSLKTTISLMLSSRQPMWIGWGPHATFLYNDAYISVLGQTKHPWALGRPAAEVWAEIWDICGPLAAVVFEQGDATLTDDVRLFMNRGDFLEETYFSFSYSPIRDESGNVAGLFCPNLDVTAKHLNARRLRTLSDLATRSLTAKTVDAACTSAIAILADNPDDVPFALLYLGTADGRHARLVSAAR
ncbi:MAG: two-component system sensor histidine kinase/response regulator, partial [Massilia sp.]